MAKEEFKQSKIWESALHAQVAATQTMVAATVRKNELMEEANLLVIMTLPSTQDLEPEAVEYLRLRRREELKKLRRRLAEEEEREVNQPALTSPVPAIVRRPMRRHWGRWGAHCLHTQLPSKPKLTAPSVISPSRAASTVPVVSSKAITTAGSKSSPSVITKTIMAAMRKTSTAIRTKTKAIRATMMKTTVIRMGVEAMAMASAMHKVEVANGLEGSSVRQPGTLISLILDPNSM